MAATLSQESLERYVEKKRLPEVVSSIVHVLLAAKPDNPRKWLLGWLEKEISDTNDGMREADLHSMFQVTRRITSEIVPQDTINLVISETVNLIGCDRVCLFLQDKKMGMLRLHASSLETSISVSFHKAIASRVLQAGKTLNIPDCHTDFRLEGLIDATAGCSTRSLITVPITDFEGTAVGVIQAINKLPRDGNGAVQRPEQDGSGDVAVPFTRHDEKILQHLTQHIGVSLRNAEMYNEAIGSVERTTGLLETIQSLSHDLGTQSLLLTITMHANKIVSAQRSTVFLLDEQAKQLWSVSTDTGQEIRIPMHAGIAGQCCQAGEVMNIADAYEDDRFDKEVDRKTGFRTHNILAVPMLCGSSPGSPQASQRVVGVIQMINKVTYDGQLEAFNESDVEVMDFFARFVGQKLSEDSTIVNAAQRPKACRTEAESAFGDWHTPVGAAKAGGASMGRPSFSVAEEGETDVEDAPAD